MSRQWKPGDVARVTDPVEGELTMIYISKGMNCWHGARADGSLLCLDATQAVSATSLVVIDPKDREQVERLGVAIYDAGFTAASRLQAALRSLIADPKPPEPTGLGAVVEDAEGGMWIRHKPDSGRLRPTHAWYPAGYVHGSIRTPYSDIDAVRIVAPGVQP